MTTIVFCYPADAADQTRLCSAGKGWELVFSDQSTIAADLFRADVFCGHAKVPVDWAGVVDQGRLRWIHSSAAGLDHCLAPEVIASEIVVSGSSGLFADQVAEQTLALVYGLMRGLQTFFRARQQRTFERLPVDDLRLKTVAVLGCGGNGWRVAQLLAPATRRLVATDMFPQQVPRQESFDVVHSDETARVISESDVVICTLPLTDTTRGMLDHAMLERIRPGGYFVNTGRGQIVDEAALVRLLADGHLRGAGLDVFQSEPPDVTSPLWTMDNVIMTPHVGAQSATRNRDITSLFCENLRRFTDRQPLINLVDKRLGFPKPAGRLPGEWRSLPWAQ